MKQLHNVALLLKELEQKIATAYDDLTLCNQYAWWTLETISKKSKTELILQQKIELTAEQQTHLDQWLEQLTEKHIPIQYLIGSVPFNGLDLLVTSPTLIPRPETEEWVISLIGKLNSIETANLNILDIGTGSGCIALTIAQAFPQAHLYAIDIADTALELAQKNAECNNITNVIFIKSDLFNKIPSHLKFDIIISNPPYIAEDEWKKLDTSVAIWEDKQALVANEQGYKIIKELINQAPHWLQANNAIKKNNLPQVILEIGYEQGIGTLDLMKRAGYTNICVEKDLEHKDRVVTGRVDNVAPYAQNRQ